MLGRRWMDFVCHDFEVTDRNAFEELRGGEPLVTYQTAHRRSDGSPVYLLVNARLRTDEQGTMIGVTGTSTNVTDRKRSEEALRESEQRVQLALTGADLGLWDWNIASGEASYNERWARMLGYRVDEVEPTIAFWRKLVHHADRLRVARLVVAHRRSTIPLLEVELRLRCKSGAWCWVLCRGRIIERDADGGPLRAAGTILDITERKQANEALQVANEQLESKVAERTRELETANERLTELDRLKSEFLATMSHELRTPLNSIIGFVGILLMGLPGEINEEQRKQLQMVKSSATLLLGLINDLLDLSRIESGNMELYRQQFSAQEVLDEVCKSLMPLIEQKQLELHKSAPTESVQIFSDRKRFYQIVLNLLNNAVKFTERGRVDVHLHATEDFISVAIRDTGIGIKQENMGLLFTAFRQVDGSARRNYEGSGLGLHLCRKLLDLLGGDIEVESQFGKGSCFTFWLPRNLKEPKK
jgi:PAS domain S-box-containing protein